MLDAVVITGTYGEEPVAGTPAAVRIITAKELEQRGATNLSQALTTETGIRVTQDALLGSALTVNGISGQNVKLLVDGIPVIGRLNGNIDLSQMLLNNVNRIELVEGPLSVSYGTDALGGTVNLITRKDQIRHLEGSAEAFYESAGQYNFNTLLGYKRHRNRCGLVFARNFFDGWSEADTMRSKEWKPREQYFGQAYYVRTLGKSSLQYKGDVFSERILNRGNPRPPYFETAFDDWYKTQRLTNALILKSEFMKHHRLDVTASHSHYERVKNTYFKDLVNLTEVMTTPPGDQDTTVFTLIATRGTWSITPDSSRLAGQVGYDVNAENAKGLRIADGHQDIGDYALFGSIRWKPIDRLMMQGGVRAGYNNAYRHPLIPSVNAKLDIRKNLILRSAYARGFRAPSLKELYFFFVDANHNIMGNNDLKAEYSNHVSASLTNLRVVRRADVMIRITGYYNDIRNLITLAQISGDAFSYVNIGEYRTTGARFGIDLDRAGWSGSVVAGINYTNTSERGWHSSPEVSGRAGYEFERWKMSLNGYYKFSGRSVSFGLDETGSAVTRSLGAYHLADVTLTKSFAGSRLQAVVGAKNLFDVTRITVSGGEGGIHGASGEQLIGWGRTAFVSMKVKLGYD